MASSRAPAPAAAVPGAQTHAGLQERQGEDRQVIRPLDQARDCELNRDVYALGHTFNVYSV